MSGPDAVCFGVLPACWTAHAWPVRREDDSGGDVGPPHRWTAVWGQPHVRPWSLRSGRRGPGRRRRTGPSVRRRRRRPAGRHGRRGAGCRSAPQGGERDRLDLGGRPAPRGARAAGRARQPGAVLVDRRDHLVDALAPGRDGLDDRRPPVARPARSPSAIMPWMSRTVASAPSRSALLTTKTSAISRMPAFTAWIASPMPGASSTTRGVGQARRPRPRPGRRRPSRRGRRRSRRRPAPGPPAGSAGDRPPRWPRMDIDRM